MKTAFEVISVALPTMYRGGAGAPSGKHTIYATSDPIEARQFGKVEPITLTFTNPLTLDHVLGVSWRDRIEATVAGPGDWLSKLHESEYDGVVYRWQDGKIWTIQLGAGE